MQLYLLHTVFKTVASVSGGIIGNPAAFEQPILKELRF